MKRLPGHSSFVLAGVLGSASLAIGTLRAQAPALTPPPVGQDGLRDIAPPVPPTLIESMDRTDWLLLTGGAVLLSVAVYLAWYFFLRPKAALPTPAPDPREVARTRLMELRRRAADLSSRDFGAEASGILRQFIRARFGISTLRRTSEEFLAAISRDHSFSPREGELLQRFLTQCDALKFANVASSHPEALRLTDDAMAFVEHAAPPAPPRLPAP